jgi:hypothetical protein
MYLHWPTPAGDSVPLTQVEGSDSHSQQDNGLLDSLSIGIDTPKSACECQARHRHLTKAAEFFDLSQEERVNVSHFAPHTFIKIDCLSQLGGASQPLHGRTLSQFPQGDGPDYL